jgi:putative ABC transport system permease protein
MRMDSWLQDIRYAIRGLKRRRGFTVAAVLTLAIGIGGTAATFSVVDATVLQPLPFPHADRLVRLRELTPQGEGFSFSEPDYQDYARAFRSLSAVAGIKPLHLTLTGAGESRSVDAAAVTSTIFPMLGIQPALGRVFGPDDERDGHGAAVVVLSQALWRVQFGGDPAAIGRVVRLDGSPVTIVGVLPASAAFPPADAWVPFAPSPAADRTDKWLDAIATLAPGATIDEARAEAATIAANLAREHPELRGWSAQVVPIADWLVGSGLRRMVWVLLGAVGLLLALACANIAGLLMTRAADRQGEIGIRLALGAERRRLVRQLLTESLVLAVLGGALGLMAAFWMLDAWSALIGGVLPLGRIARIDARVLAVTVGVIGVSTLLFGLMPALHGANADLVASLRPSGRSVTPGNRRWSGILVSVQVALAMVLLVGSFLLMGSFARLTGVNPGFDAANVLAVPLSLSDHDYPESARGVFFDNALARLSSVPGVESAAATATNPFRQWGYANNVTPEDRAATAPPSGLMQAGWRSVTPGFFQTMKIPIVRGRGFTPEDRAGAPRVVVISQGLAARLWPGGDAIGRRLYWGGVGGRTRTVVGVVGDIRDVQLDAQPMPMVYLSYSQLPLAGMTLVVRTRAGTPGVADSVRRLIRDLDPAMPVPDVLTIAASRAAAISVPRFRAVLVGAFGAVALLLAAVGLYGVVAFTVAQRTREIAIRVAIGARPAQVTGIFFRRGLRLTIAGGVAGLFGAWALSGVLRSLLFETEARDPRLFALAAAVLTAVALLASYLPARRAAGLDAAAALTREQL